MRSAHDFSLGPAYDRGRWGRLGPEIEMLQIHYLDMSFSQAVDARIRRWADRLSRYCGDIQRCEVWLASPHGHHRKGALYGVRILLTVPGEAILVDLQPSEEDVHLAIRRAFDAARRRLQDYERSRRADVKAHPRARGDSSHRRLVPPRLERV